jgi:SAM-dependent methyltransferase
MTETEPPLITAELVRAFYETFLGRAPENDRVVEEKLRTSSIAELLRDFTWSPEGARRFPEQLSRFCLAPVGPIDVDVAPEALEAMFDRVRRAWTALGETAPFWSVITKDEYRTLQADDPAVMEFMETGRGSAQLIDAFAERAGHTLEPGLCVEFGAGVGRVTRHLAERFERVLAVDVSPGNQRICRQLLEAQGVTNVDFLLLESPADVTALPDHEFFFSLLVFQHNPPPIQKYLLNSVFAKVKSGGALLIQLPTHTPEYSFRANEYLESDEIGLEMHCLPMAEVFESLRRNGLAPREVMIDGWTGIYGSHTFFAVKPR